MKKSKKYIRFLTSSTKRMVLVAAALTMLGATPYAYADIYQEQIDNLNSQNAQTRQSVVGLQVQASSYQDAISKLQAQISAAQAAIAASQTKQAQLQQQIIEDQQQIDQQRAVLSTSVKSMYVDGTPTTIEQLATSKNLSEFVDKEEYRNAVQRQIQDTVKKITALQKELQAQKIEIDQLLATQKLQQAELASQQSQQANLLSFNQNQQDQYNSQINANSSKIADLRRQQIAANARFIGGSSGAAGNGPTCGGGYPAKWCEIAQDSVLDSWGMYNRECVSYTAFKVDASGRNMPYWGGYGNANQWDDNARAAGIPVDGNPQAGDVAISNSGAYGHAMYVESVNPNGTINISQYNASLNGRYSTNTISVGSLVFIHFR